MFSDAEGMPAAYQHLRVRLRIEQSRLICWGEKIGLVEEQLDRPSRTLQLNRNLIIDILLEIQALFRECVKIQDKYDGIVEEKPLLVSRPTQIDFERRFPKGTNTFLTKTLGVIEKTPQVPKRLMWAAIKQDSFQTLIEKLIGYNDSIEALLDTAAMTQLQIMQQQTHMVMLQLNSKVEELVEISRAMKINSQTPAPHSFAGFSRSSTLIADQQEENESFARLADFKAQQIGLEKQASSEEIVPIERSKVKVKTSGTVRSEGLYEGKSVWIEWKEYHSDHNLRSTWNQTIEGRVKKLATLLGSEHKPEEFRAPRCLGYFDDQNDSQSRYGFIYEKPDNVPSETKPVSLLELIKTKHKPSLTKRIALAHALARCLMYLHSVNWLHKGLRSNSVVFFTPPREEADYGAPCLSGFDYARPDLPEEVTEPPAAHSENDIYRHPNVLGNSSSRSKKSHDIYSLGVVLIEIAYWQRIDSIVNLSESLKAARKEVRGVKEMLLGEKYMKEIEGSVGEIYQEVVRKCLTGGKELGSSDDRFADETDKNIGADMQKVFSDDIVRKLGSMTL
jgi:hypothetical protein